MNDNQKTRDELIAEMEDQIKKQNAEYLQEVATPGVVVKVNPDQN